MPLRSLVVSPVRLWFTALVVSALVAAAPVAAIDFQGIPALGIEYKTEVKVNASESLVVGNLKKASYNFLQATVTINNLQNQAKNLMVCELGYSRRYDAAVRRTEIDMTFDGPAKSLSCALSQNQEMTPTRMGQMGCRQVTLAPNQKGVAVPFVSGNKRTTIKKPAAQWVIDQIGPVQDGVRSADKLIAAGGAGAGGHPLVSPNTINGKRERMNVAIKTFVTRFLLSSDANVKLADDAQKFNCNKCMGMGSTLGDPDASRTDFFLNPPSDAVKTAANLKVATQYDSLKDILLAAGAKTRADIDLLNESSAPVLVTLSPTIVDLPPACTAQLVAPASQPISIPPHDTVPATVEFDCDSTLSPNATADVVLAMSTATATPDLLGTYWIKGRNAAECDVNFDGVVDVDDIDLIAAYRNTPASGQDDELDVDGDGSVTVLDARACQLQCTNPLCAR